jgi:hypothetical protein
LSVTEIVTEKLESVRESAYDEIRHKQFRDKNRALVGQLRPLPIDETKY